jgi:hypothetical protein
LLPHEASRYISMRVSHCRPPVDFVAQPINRTLLGFEAQMKKLSR